MGHYNNCAVIGTYRFPNSLVASDIFLDTLKHALAKTIDRHPELCYGIHHRSGEEPAHLYRIPELKWDDIVEVEEDLVENGDPILEKAASRIHDRRFTDQYNRPAWTLSVLKYQSQGDSNLFRVDIIFAGHHGVADGGSCLAFQKTIQAYLYQDSAGQEQDRVSRWPYAVPDTASSPILLEDKMPLKPFLDLPVVAKVADTILDPWTANPPTVLNKDSLHTQVASLTLPFAQVTDVLAYCRQRGITLTGLLHGLILIYLSKALPQAQTFRGSTPISLRAFTGTSTDEIVNHISSIYHDWKPEHISLLRRSSEKSSEENEAISIIAQSFQDEVRAEMKAIPIRGPEAVFIARILENPASIDEMCLAAEKSAKRSTTYEVSNVGLLKASELNGDVGGQVVRLERAMFTQSAMMTGCPLNCSVVSVAHGPLAITLTWLEGVVDDAIVYGLRDFLSRRLSTATPEKA